MNNLVSFTVTATTETALKKLAKANIPVYKVKKVANKLYFSVNQEYVEKVFAIFAHPCYNISIGRQSAKTRFRHFASRRFGLFIGAAAFAACALLSNLTVLKIKVTGSGSYLSPSVLAIAEECGAREYSFCTSLDKPLLTARVLALKGVNFCSVQRRGAYLIIDVSAEEEEGSSVSYKNLTAPRSGVVQRIVAVCGTPQKSVGERVEAGETLIGAYRLSESGEEKETLAVGFAEIMVEGELSLFFEKESEESATAALSATSLYSDKILKRECKAYPCEGGFTYKVTFTYLITASINME